VLDIVCSDCGAVWQRKKTAGSSRCRSCSTKLSYVDNPELRCKRSEAHKAARERGCYGSDYIRKMSKGLRRAWSRGAYDGIHSDAANFKRSSAAKDRWADPEFRARMEQLFSDPEYRAQLSRAIRIAQSKEEAGKNMSESSKKMWQNPEYREKMKKAMHKTMLKRWARGDFDGVDFGNHGNPSQLELEVLAAFVAAGVDAVGQHRPSGCRFTYDIYLPEYQALVEVDGEYWHYSEDAKSRGAVEQDAAKDDWALSNGFDIMRLPEIALRDQGIIESVDSALGMLT